MIASSTAAAPQGQGPTSLIHRIAEGLDADPDVVRREPTLAQFVTSLRRGQARERVDGLRVSETDAGVRVYAEITVRRGRSLLDIHRRLSEAVREAVRSQTGQAPTLLALTILGTE
ncbi:hypothetical protein I6H58_06265 [Rothia kristinae]|uniref:Uncharacterized protein n=1 Tax=Rothia kristinae TaxID=37923 RepID=A0A7T4MSA8_9MICC|nr:hypothetical protein [Rothia kristinae]MDN5640958.1 hypothetical protein [Actinomycetes bacterium]QQC58604.1 hypothetical protein I6H58_06265 [Rothia kristinae]